MIINSCLIQDLIINQHLSAILALFMCLISYFNNLFYIDFFFQIPARINYAGALPLEKQTTPSK